MSFDTHIILAAKWLADGYPPKGVVDQIDYVLLGDAMQNFSDERESHRAKAQMYATAKTGYSFSLQTMMTDAYGAWEILWSAEYERLEAAAKERRILALAAVIKGE